MNASDLVRRIRLGEDSTLELKAVRLTGRRVDSPDRRALADELAAMANGRGGSVVLGVDDKTRQIEGIPLEGLDAVETWVRDICNDSIRPALDANILKVELEDAEKRRLPVVRIDIERSLFVHESPGGCFRRIGSSKRRMATDALARLLDERSQGRLVRFDESIVPGTSLADLHDALTQRFLTGDAARESAPGIPDNTDTLRKLRIVADDEDGNARLTLSGVLLCTSRPQRWLPHAYVQAVAYAGERTDIDYQIDARDIAGPLDEQVSEALHFVRRNMLSRGVKNTARSERPQFGERAAFEALVNAVAHRDYSMAGARVRLHLFSDRIELFVPGSLTNTMTPDSLHLRQSNRNELIVSLLARCPAPSDLGRTRLMDRRGDGVPIIIEECERLSGRRPEYSVLDDSELRLIMWASA